MDQYDFGDEHTNESLKPISKEFNDNCIRLDSTHQNFDENLNKMYSEIAILEQLFQTWEEFESKAKSNNLKYFFKILNIISLNFI